MIDLDTARGLAIFRVFHPTTRVMWGTAPDGRRYWLTRAGMRVAAITNRDAGRPIRASAVATEARVSLSTVYRTLHRLQGLGVITLTTTRGRLGSTVARWVRRLNLSPIWNRPTRGERFTPHEPVPSPRFARHRAWDGMDALVAEVFG